MATALNPPAPAGGIPDGLSAAFDSALTDLGLNDDDSLQEAFQSEVGDPKPEPEPAPEPAEGDDEAPPRREPRPASPRPQPTRQPWKPGDPKPAETAKPAEPPVETPAGFDAERAAEFKKLPPPAQKFVAELTNDYIANAQGLNGYARYAQQVRRLITDEHRQAMVAGGFKNEVEAIAHLFNLNDWATKDFPAYARWAVGQYGGGDIATAVRALFPEAFTGEELDEGGQEIIPPRRNVPAQPDPFQRQVYDTLGNVVRRLDAVEVRNREARLRSADQVIANFRTEKDAAGQPRFPYLKEVERVVARIVRQPEYLAIEDMRERLAAAYDAAVAWTPKVREKARAAERAAWEAEAAKKGEVAKARKAKAVISSPTTGTPQRKTQGLDAAVETAMSSLGL